MQKTLCLIIFFLSTLLCAQKIELRSLEFSGEYCNDLIINLDKNINKTSVKDLYDYIKSNDNRYLTPKIDSGAVIIGYGNHGEAKDFFAIVDNPKSDQILADIKNMPKTRGQNEKLFVFFVQKNHLSYLNTNNFDHSFSPFNFLIAAGNQIRNHRN
jgi:hypothetical protein